MLPVVLGVFHLVPCGTCNSLTDDLGSGANMSRVSDLMESVLVHLQSKKTGLEIAFPAIQVVL
jgi:hypothetical protein